MAGPSSPSQEGPDDVPPPLPEGWLAQWDGGSRKYYYVQRATGYSQWEVPTKPALSAPTPEPTPQGIDPFGKPIDTKPAPDAEYAGQDRSLLGDLAMGVLGGGRKQSNHSSSLGGFAQNVLGNSKPPGVQTPTNVGGQLLDAFLGGNKPHGQSSSSNSQGQGTQGGQGPQTGHTTGGLISGLLHGHHGQQQNANFGYNPGQPSGAAYSGQPPSTTYSPALQTGAYGPSSGPYRPFGTNNQFDTGPQAQLSSSATSSSPYQSQATPQPFNTPQAPQGQQFQSSHSTQFQSSHPSTPSFGQHSNSYSSQANVPSLGQYGQHHNKQPSNQTGQHPGFPGSSGPQNSSNNFPPPPGQVQTPKYPIGAHATTANFSTPASGQSQTLYSQQQQQQQQQPPLGNLQNFPPPPGPQFGQQNIPTSPNYPPPPGNQGPHNQPSASSQHQQNYTNSPAPPMHNQTTHQGYSSISSSQAGHNTVYPPQAPSTDCASQTQDRYTGNYAAPPPAPSWR